VTQPGCFFKFTNECKSAEITLFGLMVITPKSERGCCHFVNQQRVFAPQVDLVIHAVPPPRAPGARAAPAWYER
jgi:hypothetical protein